MGLGLTHRDNEGQCVDHLQDERHMEDLLPDVALGDRGTSEPARGRSRAIGQSESGKGAGSLEKYKSWKSRENDCKMFSGNTIVIIIPQ